MSTLKVDTVQSATTNADLTLKGSGTGTVSLPAGSSLTNANVTGNLSVTRSLAVGYTDGRVPQANLDIKGNAFISGLSYPTSDGTSGQLIKTDGSGTLSFTSHSAIVTAGDVLTFYSANTTGNVSLGRGLSVGYVGEKVPGANLDVNGNAYISGATSVGGALTLGTDLAVAQGGTGASTFTDGGVLLGSGTSAITAMGVLTDGQMIVGDGTTDPVAESGDTLRISIGVGSTASGTVMQVYSANASGNVSVGRSLAVGYVDGRVPRANLEVKGNVYISGNVAIAGATNYPEDVKAVFGSQETGPLQIYHSSGDVSKIEDLSGTSGGLRIRSSSISLRDAEDDVIIAASSTGAFLYHNGNERLKTISGGIIMSGGLGANVAGNVSVSRSLAIGYTDGRVPQANLDVTGNVFIGGQPSSLKTGIDTLVTFASGLGVASGGTGAASLTDGGVLLGSGTSAITAMAVLTDGQMIVGDGTTDPVAESGDTLRTSIGVGSTASGTVMQIYSANTTANVRFARGVAIGYANSKVPGSNLDVKGNAVISSNVVASSLDVTNYFKVGDGAVAQPSIANLGDGNTGIWYPAADTIAISTGGTEAIRISGVGQNTTFSSHVVSHKGLAISNYTEYANNIVNAGSSFTVSTGTNVSRYTLNSSHCEITLPAGQPIKPASMKTIILYLKQDATGGRTVDFNAPGGEALEWNNSASEPEVVSGASKVSIYTFMKFHSDTNWYCAQSFIEN